MTRTLVRGLSRPLTRGLTRATLDPDAAAYIAAVEAADGQTLEPAVRLAYDEFIRGCKLDTFDITSGDVVAGATFRNWDRIKASCILAGARTLSGALVPLVGSAPTNNNFLPADYVRATGLKGNGSTKWLNSNRNNNADPRDDNHNAVWVYDVGTQTVSPSGFPRVYMGSNHPDTGSNVITGAATLSPGVRNRTGTFSTLSGTTQAGLLGISRSAGANYVARHASGSVTLNVASNLPDGLSIGVFARQGVPTFTDARLAFYSIGEAIDLAALDARLTALTNRLRFSITTGEDWRNYDPATIAYAVKLFDSGITYA